MPQTRIITGFQCANSKRLQAKTGKFKQIQATIKTRQRPKLRRVSKKISPCGKKSAGVFHAFHRVIFLLWTNMGCTYGRPLTLSICSTGDQSVIWLPHKPGVSKFSSKDNGLRSVIWLSCNSKIIKFARLANGLISMI